MVKAIPEFGKNILASTLNGFDDYILVTMEEPWVLLEPLVDNEPIKIIYNHDMSLTHLERLERDTKVPATSVVGFGGGTACDTAKYLAWKWQLPLITAPSIISVDAWLCTSIAVRHDHKVRYIGNVEPRRVLVDLELIKQAPPSLNRAGISDTISICTALGDWLIAHEIFDDRFDRKVFNQAKDIVNELMAAASDIKEVNDAGIRAMVKGFVDEVNLCEGWGDARPEEGGEHFLAYCLEEITRDHYIHGNLIGLNVLIVLQLQKDKAVFPVKALKSFFDDIELQYSPISQGITRDDFKQALESVQQYVRTENLANGLWSLENVFDDSGPCSVNGILDWIYSFST
ncbi:iron-containing alcohol dehydrogenase [Candidatus Bathyarchaeota archaeon]|nr:iron-containing alcohol dehydrogenase [Candidatus Bathyarchaeota archaeon]